MNSADNLVFDPKFGLCTPEELEKKRTKRVFSNLGFYLCALLFTIQILPGFFLGIALAITGEETLSQSLTMLISSLSGLVLGVPLFALLTKKLRREARDAEALDPPVIESFGIVDLIAAFAIGYLFMILGANIGTLVNNLIGGILGLPQDPVVEGSIEGLGIVECIVFMAIFPAITEELLMRKLLIDSIPPKNKRLAVLFSAITFGLLHGNFEQFFYAFLLGIILAEIYVMTKNVVFPILLHMSINLAGSTIPLLAEKYESLIIPVAFIMIGILLVGMVLLGVFNKKISQKAKEIFVVDLSPAILNAGTIAFAVLCLLLFILVIFS